jgi:hypothetical protein
MTAWNTLGRPASPRDFEVGFNYETETTELWNGTDWVELSGGEGGSGLTQSQILARTLGT